MLINADLSAPVTVIPEDYRWVASPQAGVERVMLDRVGGEVARATSLVRYAQGSSFPAHKHPGGEEILVLSGVFSDEHGDYPVGWYLRNPPGSSHRPHSHPGALILVKLCQIQPDEDKTIRVNTMDPANWRVAGSRNICKLFDSDAEHVYMERLRDAGSLEVAASGGIEIFILSGMLLVDGERCSDGSWIRLPAGASSVIHSAGESMVFVKSGHLNVVQSTPQ